jgi:hypothetical protein
VEDTSEEKLFDSNGLRGNVSVAEGPNVGSALKVRPAVPSPIIERFNTEISGSEPELSVFSIDVTDASMEDEATLFDELLRQRIAKVKRVSADVSKQLQAIK